MLPSPLVCLSPLVCPSPLEHPDTLSLTLDLVLAARNPHSPLEAVAYTLDATHQHTRLEHGLHPFSLRSTQLDT